jgi:hypothetical protein
MLRQLVVLLGIGSSLVSGATAFAAEAGKVVFVTGEVRLAQKAAQLDAAVQEGDELSTGADGYIYVKTVDAGFLILRPNSKARIAAYHIDDKNPANTRVKLELLDGVARSISGQAVKKARQNFRFNTPVAAIGVRGTDFIVYTDQQTSRVSVVSGGVVMSGFAGACGPDGGGPCEGSASRELFAGQSGMLLQVQRGQNIPQLLHSPTVSPDQSAPPRSDEPVGKPANAAGGVPQDLSLDAQKGSNPLISGKPLTTAQGGNGDGQNSVKPPPEVEVVPPVTEPVVRSAPEVLWGRWQAVAGVAPDAAVNAELNSGKYNSGYVLGSYVIKRVADPTFVMPREGTASFTLESGEATLTPTKGTATLATVQDGFLNMDFQARSFNTGLTVAAGNQKLNVAGKGDITAKGELYSSPLSDAVIRGYLGGAHAEEAVYLFKSVSSPDLTAEGVVRWRR